ncbi:hypothetical protein [Mycobacterium lepromatosis]|nr:hypothetical protein [Mycobacterium lepromatosis]
MAAVTDVVADIEVVHVPIQSIYVLALIYGVNSITVAARMMAQSRSALAGLNGVELSRDFVLRCVQQAEYRVCRQPGVGFGTLGGSAGISTALLYRQVLLLRFTNLRSTVAGS